MGEAALNIAGQERGGPDFDLVRRLLLPPGWLGPRPYRLPEPDEAPEEDLDELVAQLEAENKVMKAVIRSEREAAAELRAQVAALTPPSRRRTTPSRTTCGPTATAGPRWSSACCSPPVEAPPAASTRDHGSPQSHGDGHEPPRCSLVVNGKPVRVATGDTPLDAALPRNVAAGRDGVIQDACCKARRSRIPCRACATPAAPGPASATAPPPGRAPPPPRSRCCGR